MFSKFAMPEADLSPDDPRFVLMESWADFDGTYQAHYMEVAAALSEVSLQALRAKRGSGFNKSIALEARLQALAPQFAVAMQGLKRALDGVEGWQITWRHHERGEPIGSKVVAQEEDMIASQVVRSPAQYHLNDGWILGLQTGVDTTFGGLGVWVEIGINADDPRGLNFPLAAMFAIELTPPSVSESQ